MIVPGLVALISGTLLVAYVIFAVKRSRDRKAGRVDGGAGGRFAEPEPVVARLPKSLAPKEPAPASGPTSPPATEAIEPAVLADPAGPSGGVALAVAGPPAGAGPAAAPADGRSDVLPELAAGVQWPCDLTPLVDVAARPGATERAVFVTTTAPGEVVRRELEASFEAAGGHISWYDGDIGLIRRHGVEANVQVHLTPQSAAVDASAAFPTAPEASIVVDLWV